MDRVVFTGFPGFLGGELLPRVLERMEGTIGTCLVQAKFAGLARSRADEIVAAHPRLKDCIEIVEGDIAIAGLGLSSADEIARTTVQIFHLAAVYDLSVPRDFAMRVNVDGTRNVLAFAKSCPSLRRLHYVSTCYVSGRFDGIFTEADLEKGQVFNNFYEETKYLAEVDVQKEMRAGLPATIYRPSVVVGDSESGATRKYDGPYFVIQWIERQPRISVLPVVGNPNAYEFNVVPSDFVVDGIEWLSGKETSLGKIYQLADPRALTVDGVIRTIAEATQRKVIRIPMPLGLAKFSIEKVPGVYALMKIPSSAIPYFVHPTRYRTPQTTADLAGSGIEPPPFSAYAHKLVQFFRAHREVGSAAMV
ncbi:MAG: SDR family oxidoreductase [Thermoanaerobaculia bacterium]